MLESWDHRFEQFHRGLCPICGRHTGGELVTDHDHQTGLVRSLLFRGCNVQEGASAALIVAKYRQAEPRDDP